MFDSDDVHPRSLDGYNRAVYGGEYVTGSAHHIDCSMPRSCVARTTYRSTRAVSAGNSMSRGDRRDDFAVIAGFRCTCPDGRKIFTHGFVRSEVSKVCTKIFNLIAISDAALADLCVGYLVVIFSFTPAGYSQMC